MEYLKPKIEFYRQRTFSEKLNAVFDFIRENWRPLLKYSFYLIIPVCLIQTLATNAVMSFSFKMGANSALGANRFGDSMISILGNFGAMMFCMLIGSAIMSGLIYALMQTYSARENRLQNVTLNDFKEVLVKNIWKYIRLILAILFVYLLSILIMVMAVVLLSAWSLVITIPLFIIGIICLLPLMIVIPVYIFERHITFWDAIRKAWKLGYATMGGMLGLMIVLYFISSVIQTVSMLPWYILLFAGNMFSLASESTMNQSVIYKFLLYILGLIQSYGMYVSTIIGIIGLAFQYFHAREKVEGVTIETNISNFNSF